MQQIFKSSDLVLLTETWTDDFSDISVNHVEHFVLNRKYIKAGSRRNSSGIILYLRNKFVSNDTLVFTSEDDFLWVKISKTVLSSDKDLYICLCYIIPDESSRQTIVESNIFDRLVDSVVHIENKAQNDCSLLICGDFNSRTSINPDFVVDDDPVHMSVLPDEYTLDIELQRFSEDRGHTDNNGLLLLELCKQTGLRIMNGRVGDYGIGRYTFVGSRGSSVVDYVLSSQDLFQCISKFEVHDPNVLSDHCLLTFSFTFQNSNVREVTENEYEQVQGKFVWNNDFKSEYIGLLGQPEIAETLNGLNARIPTCMERDEINNCLSEFSHILEDVASPIFKTSSNNTQKDSLERDYSEKKTLSHGTMRDVLKRNITFYECLISTESAKMMKAESVWLRQDRNISRCSENADTNMIKRKHRVFLNAKYKDAKMYWNLLKESAGIRTTNVSLSTFEQYFKAVNNPLDPFYSPDEDIIYFNERYENNEFSVMFEELN